MRKKGARKFCGGKGDIEELRDLIVLQLVKFDFMKQSQKFVLV